MNKQINTLFTQTSPCKKTHLSKLEKEQLSRDFSDIVRKTEPIGHHCFAVSSLPCNMTKNRYLDVKPSDHTRVILNSLPNIPGSDYINASYIEDRAYISCQAPLHYTIGDFWRMIWETKSSLIIMLTRLSERGCVKAQTYWPCAEGESMMLDAIGLELQLNKITYLGGITARSLTLIKRSSTNLTTRHDVLHLHYTLWPDHGAPSSTEDICRMLDLHDHISKESRSGPTVVHCSAGIGRSGAFIAADILLKRMKVLTAVEHQKNRDGGHQEENKRNSEESNLIPLRQLKKIVEELREHRRGMVQTEDQYKFIYQIYKDKVCSSQGLREKSLREILEVNDQETIANDLSIGFPSPSVSSWAMSPAQSPTSSAVRS